MIKLHQFAPLCTSLHRHGRQAILAAVLVAVFCQGVTAQCQPPHPAVVALYPPGRPGVQPATGVLIDSAGELPPKHAIVVTNEHVARYGNSGWLVNFADGGKYLGRVIDSDPALDLAALLIARPATQPVKIADRLPGLGAEVTACGYGGGCYRARPGRAIHYEGDNLVISGMSTLGDSGGPMLNARGQVAAILWGTRPGWSIGTGCGPLRRFLARVFRSRRRPKEQPPMVDITELPGKGESGKPRPRAESRERKEDPPAAQPSESRPPSDVDGEKFRELQGQIEGLRDLHTKERAGYWEALKGQLNLQGERLEGQIEGLRDLHGNYRQAIDEQLNLVFDRLESRKLEKQQAANFWAVQEIKASLAEIRESAGPRAVAVRRQVVGLLWPWLLGAVGLGGLTPGVLLLRKVLRLVLRKPHQLRPDYQGGSYQRPAEQTSVQPTPPTPSKAPDPIVIHSENPPPPQIVKRDREFVEVQRPNHRLQALQWAHDEYVRRYPGARPVIETIESYADQYASGMQEQQGVQ